MRFSEETRFPHPVLGPRIGDFTSGEFDVNFRSHEDLKTGALTLEHDITLTEDGIRSLVETGKAAAGCFVRCIDTYHTELRTLAWPSGRSDFAAGTLLNRVSLRPVIWLNGDLPNWDPGTIHLEFSPPVSLARGLLPCRSGPKSAIRDVTDPVRNHLAARLASIGEETETSRSSSSLKKIEASRYG